MKQHQINAHTTVNIHVHTPEQLADACRNITLLAGRLAAGGRIVVEVKIPAGVGATAGSSVKPAEEAVGLLPPVTVPVPAQPVPEAPPVPTIAEAPPVPPGGKQDKPKATSGWRKK